MSADCNKSDSRLLSVENIQIPAKIIKINDQKEARITESLTLVIFHLIWTQIKIIVSQVESYKIWNACHEQ